MPSTFQSMLILIIVSFSCLYANAIPFVFDINNTRTNIHNRNLEGNCTLPQDCPSLENINLSTLRPCGNIGPTFLYICPSGNNSGSQSNDSCECKLDIDCPITKQIIENREFGLLKDIESCGFRKYCCPKPPLSTTTELFIPLQTFETTTQSTNDIIGPNIGGPGEDKELEDQIFNVRGGVISDNNRNFVCGIQDTLKIFGGRDAEEHEYPWNVALVYQSLTNESSQLILCGGVLIGPTAAITAAHCMVAKDDHYLKSIKIGHSKLNLTKSVELIAASIHEEYDKFPTIRNDLAMLHFNELEFSFAVKPICLPNKRSSNDSTDNNSGIITQIAGWGITRDDPNPNNLKTLEMEKISGEDCEKEYEKIFPGFQIEDIQLCAKGVLNNSDSCRGDSGSPLMTLYSQDSKWVVEGITSYGTRKCDSSLPGVYTRVDQYLDWIDRAIENAASTLDQPRFQSKSSENPFIPFHKIS